MHASIDGAGTKALGQLRAAAPAILPSLLLCDFGHLGREIERLEAAGVPALHLDVMDGHFVPNLTYGMPIVAAARQLTQLPLDVHLMISRPEQYALQFLEAGANLLTFHLEASARPATLLRTIRQHGGAAGLAINPDTPLAQLEPLVDECDLVLVMSVMPGFGGQAFDPVALDELRRLRELAGDRLGLAIDGGVNLQTIADCAAAGAEMFVVGSAIFREHDYTQSVHRLRQAARGG